MTSRMTRRDALRLGRNVAVSAAVSPLLPPGAKHAAGGVAASAMPGGSQGGVVSAKRTALYQRMVAFMNQYEFFLLPVNQVLPFDVTTHYPTEIAGVKMGNYIAWMKSAYYISTVGNPAMSVPCAFSEHGLPIGIQIVGRHHDDWGVLQMGYAFEQASNIGKRRPVVV
jgi:amidase